MSAKFFCRMLFLLFFSLISYQNILSQTFSKHIIYVKVATTKDILPLSIGYTWKYNFTSVFTNSLVHQSTTDVGKLVLEVTGMILTSDSIRWQFTQWRDFTEIQYSDPRPKNIKDTVVFDLVELKRDLHQVYTPNFDMYRIFPFKKTNIDSAKIYRFTTQGEVYTRKIYSFGNPAVYPGESDSHDITFCADSGVVQLETEYRIIGTYNSAKYNLESFHTFYSDVHLQPGLPAEFLLYQNYPNPFNPTTTINYSVPKTRFVSIIIYDALGREVEALVNEIKSIGNYTVEFNATNLSSGIYFYQITTDEFIQTKKMILVR